MSEIPINAEAAGSAKLVYILYLVSLIFGITSIVGVIMAYINKNDAPRWLESHYRFQIRTFWIGLLYSLIGAVLVVVLIGWIILLFTMVWLIIRCVKGLQALDKQEAPPDPATWMF